tara:strand:+ start:5268 stop:6131 length:864 start_codon:yes stop_codon:yes gene_type:complete
MTGFGKATNEFNGTKITVEVKTLNSKMNDTKIRVPSSYREKELEIRNLITEQLDRGKIDFSLSLESANKTSTVKINRVLFEEYNAQLKGVSQEFDLEPIDTMSLIMRMPNILESESHEFDSDEYKTIKQTVIEGLTACNNFRKDEGQQLENDLKKRIDIISDHLEKVMQLAPTRVDNKREKLLARFEDMKKDDDIFDNNRFEQELIYYLEKLDITEEQVRLKAHLEYFSKTMDGQIGQGKKLGFIGQEMGREINTIGSKANHAEMQRHVVEMKDELEKIKEQVLNVL